MQRAGLSGLPLRRRAKRVPSQKTVTDLVKRQFSADGPNRPWVTDITEHPPHRVGRKGRAPDAGERPRWRGVPPS